MEPKNYIDQRKVAWYAVCAEELQNILILIQR